MPWLAHKATLPDSLPQDAWQLTAPPAHTQTHREELDRLVAQVKVDALEGLLDGFARPAPPLVYLHHCAHHATSTCRQVAWPWTHGQAQRLWKPRHGPKRSLAMQAPNDDVGAMAGSAGVCQMRPPPGAVRGPSPTLQRARHLGDFELPRVLRVHVYLERHGCGLTASRLLRSVGRVCRVRLQEGSKRDWRGTTKEEERRVRLGSKIVVVEVAVSRRVAGCGVQFTSVLPLLTAVLDSGTCAALLRDQKCTCRAAVGAV